METLNNAWKVHTPNLLKEIAQNTNQPILSKPINIFGRLLAEVGKEAIRINDAKLNALMCRLTIYSMADPESPDYDKKALDQVYKLAQKG